MRFANTTRLRLTGAGLVLLFILAFTPAYAGPLATTNHALNDGFGPDAGRWHGTLSLSDSTLGDSLLAEVDWAVFAPGGLQLYLNGEGIAQVDPSGPDELAYIYQIAFVGATSPGIDTLLVALDASDGRGTVSAPAFLPTGFATEKTPSAGGDNTTFMAWLFTRTLVAGDTSPLLLFTSPFLPEFDTLELRSGQATAQGVAASPGDRPLTAVPEPGTLWLAAAAATAAVARRRVRSQ